MNPFSFPLRYLALETEAGCKLWVRDLWGMLFITVITATPYIIVSSTNYFHKDGFVDKVGAFSSVLTGFYIAGLVAVSTFPRNKAGLDKAIELGKIRLPSKNGEPPEYLTRREYVCAMFGYLAFVSMLLTIMAIMFVTMSPLYEKIDEFSDICCTEFEVSRETLRSIFIVFWSVVLSSLLLTTIRALYYLIDRLYAVVPTPMPRKDDTDEEVC